MNPAIDKLTKFLRLEAERGFDNRAVVGGLERMLEPWKAQAQQSGVPAEVIEVVRARLRDYPTLSIQSRREVLQGLWKRLRDEFPDLSPAQLAPEERRAAPPEGIEPSAAPSRAIPEEPSSARHESKTPRPVKTRPSTSLSGPAALLAPLTKIPGVGPKTAKTLSKLGLYTLGDLLRHFPRRYDDYSKLETINRLWYGQEVTIIGTVDQIDVRPVRGGKMKLIEAVISDGTGSIRVTWFNQPWIAGRLKPGRPVVLSGKVDQYLGRLTMKGPEWEPLERQQLHTSRIVPVYPLTAGISAKWLRRVMNGVVIRMTPRLLDPLPDTVRQPAGLIPLSEALQQVHFPDSWERLKDAQERLAFDEMFLLQLGVLRQKSDWEALQTDPLEVDDEWVQVFLSALPFELTTAQRSAFDEVRADLGALKPMNRLLQGDVGSGKTVIAAAAVGVAYANGKQAAMMAPTSILAEQHHRTLLDLLSRAANVPPEAVRLLLGATPEGEKQEIREKLASGEVKLVVGTHALLEDPVVFKDLRLVITDEQHRFGVEQRAALRAKGQNPNLMVMTATPIPRSLALTIYGDLDLSVIDEMPPGRKAVETRVMRPIERSRAYTFIIGQLEAGRQAFIIYPLVEGSEKVEAKAAVDEHKNLQENVFTKYVVGLLHGRMKQAEKDAVMRQYRSGELDVLVSTSVVEVGVDIPNATVMLVEGANRFGLAQLHQFRGRVGRSEHKSYCLLIPDTEDEADNERLAAMESTDDGFKLAELDLDQRGPGDFLGKRQSGFVELQLARLSDVRLIDKARRQAMRLFANDPELSLPEHNLLAQAVAQFWSDGKGEIS